MITLLVAEPYAELVLLLAQAEALLGHDEGGCPCLAVRSVVAKTIAACACQL